MPKEGLRTAAWIEVNVIAVRSEVIEKGLPGGVIAFRALFHTRKTCSERNQFVVSLMSPADADDYDISSVYRLLQHEGIKYGYDKLNKLLNSD